MALIEISDISRLRAPKKIPEGTRGIYLRRDTVTAWHKSAIQIQKEFGSSRKKENRIKPKGYNVTVDIPMPPKGAELVNATVITPKYAVKLHRANIAVISMVASTVGLVSDTFFRDIQKHGAQTGYIFITKDERGPYSRPNHTNIVIKIGAINDPAVEAHTGKKQVFKAESPYETTTGLAELVYAPSKDKPKPTFVLKVSPSDKVLNNNAI